MPQFRDVIYQILNKHGESVLPYLRSILATKFENSCDRVYLDELRTREDVENLIRALNKAYANIRVVDKLKAEMRRNSQMTGESADKFGSRMLMRLQRAQIICDLDEYATETRRHAEKDQVREIALTNFLAGLDIHLQTQVRAERPTTLLRAIEIAREFDQENALRQARVETQQDIGGTGMQPLTNLARVMQLSTTPEVQCTRRQDNGHDENDCNTTIVDRYITCWACNMQGHRQHNCPQLPQSNNQNGNNIYRRGPPNHKNGNYNNSRGRGRPHYRGNRDRRGSERGNYDRNSENQGSNIDDRQRPTEQTSSTNNHLNSQDVRCQPQQPNNQTNN